MILACIFLVQIILLFFLSYKTTSRLFALVYAVTKNKTVSISLLSLLLYPGVVVHELSHLLTAIVLFVPVKSISLVPQMTDKTTLQGGSVTIATVDPIRRTLVGIAPLFAGIAALWMIAMYVLPPIPFLCHSEGVQTTEESSNSQNSVYEILLPTQGRDQDDGLCNNNSKITIYNQSLTIIISLYLIFSISGTMYSSKKDLEALIITIPVLLIISGIAYILGFQFVWIIGILNGFEVFFQKLSSVLLIPLGIQVVLFILLRIIRSVLSIKG